MKGRKAWVVAIQAKNGTRVVSLLSPHWGADRVRDYLVQLYVITSLRLTEQLSIARRKELGLDVRPRYGTVVDISVGAGESIVAQRSTVKEITDNEGVQSVRFRPEPVREWKEDASGKSYLAREHQPPEITCAVIDLRFSKLVPKKT